MIMVIKSYSIIDSNHIVLLVYENSHCEHDAEWTLKPLRLVVIKTSQKN